ncbi:MAG: hypothetical protein ACJAZ2_000647 [Glaciecola sp.]|jgi:hypothetical protein
MLLKKLSLLLALVIISNSAFSQACASTSIYPYEWPGHNNWFMAAGNEWTGTILNMTTLTSTVAGRAGAGDDLGSQVSQYEGTTTVSDDNGNLVMFSNGRLMWTGVGNATTQTYNGLLEGNEGGATASRGSASQGIISFRHPTAPNDIHVFTTDDANSGATVGLNHAIFDLAGNVTSVPTQLGTFRSTEALAATRHSNGIDFWVTAMDVNGNFHAYLLTCTGIDIANSNLTQAGGPTSVSGDKNRERGGLAFSYDGQKMAQAHGSLVAAEKISLYDFDNTTGAITNRMDICQPTQIFGPYDIMFSPDNQRLFVSFQLSTLDYYDISSGVPATITASRASTGISAGNGAAIQMGAKGLLYIASGNSAKGPLREIQEDINTATNFSTVDVPGTAVSLGLPRMFIPPLDRLIIADPGTVCLQAAPFDLSTSWVCAGTDAETLVHTYTSTKGAITDANLGTYDPSIVGVGTDTIIFTLTGACNLNDTLIMNVIDCNCNDTTLFTIPEAMCQTYGTLDLNTLIDGAGAGSWSVIVPDGSASTPLTGTIFDPNVSDPGVYTVTYTLDDAGSPGCPDAASRSITILSSVTDIGAATLTACSDDAPLQLTASATDALATWTSVPANFVDATTGLVDIAGAFASVGDGGTVTISYGGGCLTPDDVVITINVCCIKPVVSAPANICVGSTSDIGALVTAGTGTWSRTPSDGTSIDANGLFTSSNTVTGTYTITFTSDMAGCTDDAIITIEVLPFPIAVITPTDAVVCDGVTAILTGSSAVGTALSNLWNDGSTGNTLTASAAGDYWVIISNGACSDSDSVTVGSIPSPVVSLPADTTICSLRSDTYEAFVTHNVSGAATIEWSTIGVNNDTSVVIDATPTTMTVTVTDAAGCKGTDIIEITEYCIPYTDSVPNIFIPGGCETCTPTFTPFGTILPVDIGQSHFEVYDRWGLKMFESNELVPKWDGSNGGDGGTPCSTGVYFWIWNYTQVTGESHNLNGFVQLLQKK